jgi:hypothetical protein
LGAHDWSGVRPLVAMARPNHTFTQLLNRHFSLHFSSPRAGASLRIKFCSTLVRQLREIISWFLLDTGFSRLL